MSIEIRESAIHGQGVYANTPLRKHQIIAPINIIREITEEHPLDPEKGELYHHCHWYPDGRVILTGEPYCYTNHSCDPNVFLYTVNGMSYVFAMRDIAAGAELTLEYSLCNFDGEVWECRCGAWGCRGVHHCGFQYMEKWRQLELLPYLDPVIVWYHQDYIRVILSEMA